MFPLPDQTPTMNISSSAHTGHTLIKTTAQLALLLLFWAIGYGLQQRFHVPISAGVLGLFLALAALLCGVLKLNWIKGGADFVLGELVLFFVPCVVGLMKYQALFKSQGWQLISTITIGTVCVMVATAYAVSIGFKWEHALKQRLHAHKPAIHHE